jgi:hypothetical protein
VTVRTESSGSNERRRELILPAHWLFAPARWVLRLWRASTLRTVDIEEANANLDYLIEDAEHGHPFTIAIEGKPAIKVARMEKEDLDKLPKADE